MKRTAKIMLTTFCLIMFFATFSVVFLSPSSARADEQKTYWNDVVKIDGLTQITEGNSKYYLVGTAEELAYLSKFNKDIYEQTSRIGVRLTNNIDLSAHYWVPMYFCGVFDGNGHTISNIKIYASSNDSYGLFSILNESSNVKDLLLENVKIENLRADLGYSAAGAIAGQIQSFANINRCSVKNFECIYGGDTETGEVRIGGAVGISHGGRLNGVVTDANIHPVSEFDFPNTAILGGVVGFATVDEGNIGTNITICAVEKQATSEQSIITGYANEVYCGGITAILSKGTIEKCFADNGVKVHAGNTEDNRANTLKAHAGGIVGGMNAAGIIRYCYNKAEVMARGGLYDEGIEEEFYAQTYNNEPIEIGGKYNLVGGEYTQQNGNGNYANTTHISQRKVLSNCSYQAGIVGWAESGSKIENCYNSGNIVHDNSHCFNIITYNFVYKIQEDPLIGFNTYNQLAELEVYFLAFYKEGQIIGGGRENFTNQSSLGWYYDTDWQNTDVGTSTGYFSSLTNYGQNSFTTFNTVPIMGESGKTIWINATVTQSNSVEIKSFYEIDNGNKFEIKDNVSVYNYTGIRGLEAYPYLEGKTAGTNQVTGVKTSGNEEVFVLDTSISTTPILKDFYWKYHGTQPA